MSSEDRLVVFYAGAGLAKQKNPSAAIGRRVNMMSTFHDFQNQKNPKFILYVLHERMAAIRMANKEEEVWGYVRKCKKEYMISTKARVRVVATGELVVPHINIDGYLMVTIKREGKRKAYFVHRLLLETFVGLPPNGARARHLDDNKANLELSNLCWGTASENMYDAHKNKVYEGSAYAKGEKHYKAVLTASQVDEIRKRYKESGEPYGMQRELAQEFEVADATIRSILLNRSWKEKGNGSFITINHQKCGRKKAKKGKKKHEG